MRRFAHYNVLRALDSIVAKAPPGRNKSHGIGTQQFEVEFRVPKPGGIRKGWQRAAVSIADLRVFVFEAAGDASAPAAASRFSHELVASNIIDIRYRCAFNVRLDFSTAMRISSIFYYT